ncbi:PAS domain S-box protein [Tenericutes bacterium MO-XQ]|nr:PAS domain S-box protein [Tenericutes bacterium MO-XQ]
MSEFINNYSQSRQELLKKIIRSLHEGASFEEARSEFKKHFEDVTTQEISQMEQALIKEGMTINEVQRLCDVHAAVFDGAISDIHQIKGPKETPGHPIQVFLAENDRIEQLLKEEIEPYLVGSGKHNQLMLRVGMDRLAEIHNHYARKEYLFFPNLEKKGIDTPPKVMWAVDDEIRADLKAIQKNLSEIEQDETKTKEDIQNLLTKIRDMIFKENNILMPLLIETLSFFDWVLVDSSSDEIGYFLEKPKDSWKKIDQEEQEEEQTIKGEVKFDAGSLSPDVLNQMLNTLPFDMTFVDKDGHVKYFTQGKERIFDRPKTIIGRHVNMCHPPQSVHVVEEIVESFKSGEKDHEDFWIRMKDMFVYIRYFAVRDKNNEYLGTLEITQNIKPIVELEGEKRLISK